jgi:hypothetical protein
LVVQRILGLGMRGLLGLWCRLCGWWTSLSVYVERWVWLLLDVGETSLGFKEAPTGKDISFNCQNRLWWELNEYEFLGSSGGIYLFHLCCSLWLRKDDNYMGSTSTDGLLRK